MKKIDITFKLDGTATIEASGFKGQGCLKATEVFQAALGQVTTQKKKPEYHQQQTEQRNQCT
jgi:Protein of unknown function (DUF2997)